MSKGEGAVAAVVTLVVYAGIIYTLVRPQSQGPQLIKSITGGLASLIGTGMGSGQTWG